MECDREKREDNGEEMEGGGENMEKKWEQSLQKRGYQVERLLGKGTTAVVYLVRDERSGSPFACKTGTVLEWLLPEAELLADLCHPLFPRFHEYWCTDSYAFLVMEYVEGRSLQDFLQEGAGMETEEALGMVIQLADGIGVLHNREPMVLYRDLKPENIMLSFDGRVRLIDLGGAAVGGGLCMGTPGYAAPEQLRREHEKEGPATDVYALGRLLERLLVGKRIPRGLRMLLKQCQNQDPGLRIPGTGEWISALLPYYQPEKTGRKRGGKRRKRCFGPVAVLSYRKNIWKSEYKGQE